MMKSFWDNLAQKLDTLELSGTEKDFIKHEVLQKEGDLFRKLYSRLNSQEKAIIS